MSKTTLDFINELEQIRSEQLRTEKLNWFSLFVLLSSVVYYNLNHSLLSDSKTYLLFTLALLSIITFIYSTIRQSNLLLKAKNLFLKIS